VGHIEDIKDIVPVVVQFVDKEEISWEFPLAEKICFFPHSFYILTTLI
jgi:hypothetical protein